MIAAPASSFSAPQVQGLSLSLHSSVEVISQQLVSERRLFDWDFIKDIHFERHFLPRFLHSKAEVDSLLQHRVAPVGRTHGCIVHLGVGALKASELLMP